MPQPVKKKGVQIEWGPEALDQHPKLAVQIAKVISIWSEIDRDVGLCLSVMLTANASAVVTMLSVLGDEARRKAFLEIAELRFSPDVFRVIMAVYASTRKSKNCRNIFAHGIWGHSDSYKDSLMFIKANDQLEKTSKSMEAVFQLRSASEAIEEQLSQKSVFVYNAGDFRTEVDRAVRAKVAFNLIWQLIIAGAMRPPQKDKFDSILRELKSDPLVKSALKSSRAQKRRR